jgi:serine/threonine protein kinase/Tfp pilus assembly protein PilF
MDPQRWERIRAAFDEIVELGGAERASRLAAIGATDPELRDAVDLLLRGDAGADVWLTPVESVLGFVLTPGGTHFRSPGVELQARLQNALGSAYRVERELGGGGMSCVYVAEETAFRRKVVVKVFRPELAEVMSARRFQREIQVAAGLQHPHIVPLLSAHETDSLLYYTMPFVEGESLRDRLRREGELPIDQAVRILRDVASAIAYAHGHGVVHRDIKPENVLLSEGGAVVADFGIAKALIASRTRGDEATTTTLTQRGMALGTPMYMAPEQAAGDSAADHRVDIYALGVLAYEMLAGRAPFEGRSSQQLMAAHAIEAPMPLTKRRLATPPDLAALVMRCLEKRPADRPQSAEEVLRELEAATAPGEVSGGRQRARSNSHLATYVGVSAALIALAGYMVIARQSDNPPAPGPAVVKSVAVLPFANLSPDRENEYFADGMTEELINALTKIEGLRVPARTSSFAFKGQNLSARAIAESLRVGALLEGSVRKAGNRLRVRAQLVDAADGYQLWSETYERELEDVFAVQDEIARAIVGALKLQLGGEEAKPLVTRATADFEAYSLYLQGRYLWNQRTGEALERAARFFEQAIAKDPRYARAHAGLADTYILLPFYGNAPAKETHAKARRAAETALSLDSTLAEAHTALADIKLYAWDWRGAEQSFRQAIRLAPGYAVAHHWYADYLSVTGRLEEALLQRQLAHSLDPLSRVIATELGLDLYLLRRYDEAIARLKQVLDLDPDFAFAHQRLGEVYLQKGWHAEAIAELERAADLGWSTHTLNKPLLAYAYAASGDRARATQIVGELTSRAARGDVPPFAIALAYTGLGDKKQAIAWLDRAVATHDPDVTGAASSPLLDPLRADPRFTRLVRRMGLEPSRN